MFFLRGVYEEHGGFDAEAAVRLRFRFNERARGTGFGEDTILAWKAIRAGVPHIHVPEAVVEHHVFPPDPIEWLSRGIQMAAFPALVREVPELRETLLVRGFYLRPRNRIPIYMLIAAAAIKKRRPAQLAAGLWVLTTLRELRRVEGRWPRNIVWLPAEMALDALVSVALIAGSARARTVVL
jgi:hypothetical protein